MIRFENVTKVYARGARPALDRVSLDVERGEFVFLVGASGSGKSTFLRLVLREERASAGRVFVAGKELGTLSSWKVPTLRRQIGAVFQDFRLLPNKTVFENVAFALQVIGKPRHHILTTVPDTLEMVGLAGKEKRRPHELSGGEQQRVAIARAFVNRPNILLCDEPTGNLDPTTSLGIMRLLDRINRTGTTVVMATHDDEIVDQMRKRVIELITGEHGPRPVARRLRVGPLMRLQFILSEIGLGLRRNLSMTISVILVTFVSLTFVGSRRAAADADRQDEGRLVRQGRGLGLPVPAELHGADVRRAVRSPTTRRPTSRPRSTRPEIKPYVEHIYTETKAAGVRRRSRSSSRTSSGRRRRPTTT